MEEEVQIKTEVIFGIHQQQTITTIIRCTTTASGTERVKRCLRTSTKTFLLTRCPTITICSEGGEEIIGDSLFPTVEVTIIGVVILKETLEVLTTVETAEGVGEMKIDGIGQEVQDVVVIVEIDQENPAPVPEAKVGSHMDTRAIIEGKTSILTLKKDINTMMTRERGQVQMTKMKM